MPKPQWPYMIAQIEPVQDKNVQHKTKGPIGHSSITLSMLSVSESDVSIVSGKLFASDIYVLQSGTPNAVLSFAPLKSQMMAAIWAQTSTTRAPARHVQYQDRTSVSQYFIHKYFLMIHVDFVYEHDWDCYHLCEHIF